jgi:hypothetical protein
MLANIFMTRFEVEAIGSSLMKPKFWPRRADDVSKIWAQKPPALRDILGCLNYRHTVKFSMGIVITNQADRYNSNRI